MPLKPKSPKRRDTHNDNATKQDEQFNTARQYQSPLPPDYYSTVMDNDHSISHYPSSLLSSSLLPISLSLSPPFLAILFNTHPQTITDLLILLLCSLYIYTILEFPNQLQLDSKIQVVARWGTPVLAMALMMGVKRGLLRNSHWVPDWSVGVFALVVYWRLLKRVLKGVVLRNGGKGKERVKEEVEEKEELNEEIRSLEVKIARMETIVLRLVRSTEEMEGYFKSEIVGLRDMVEKLEVARSRVVIENEVNDETISYSASSLVHLLWDTFVTKPIELITGSLSLVVSAICEPFSSPVPSTKKRKVVRKRVSQCNIQAKFN